MNCLILRKFDANCFEFSNVSFCTLNRISPLASNISIYSNTSRCFSFSQSYARERREARVNRWYNLPARLEKVVERLRGIRIENRDALELLEMFSDRPATLMYLDPPYFVKREHVYVIDAKDTQFHSELLKICRRAKCMIIISGYDSDLYNDMLSPERGWDRSTIETYTSDTSGRDYAKTEVLWMNKQFVKARKSGRVPIRLSAREKELKKVNPYRK
ncbi:hypothetical protein ES703_74277 [subsurface metagenome]